MTHRKLLFLIFSLTLIALFLVACSTAETPSASIPISVTSTSSPSNATPTFTPMLPTPTNTPIPPTPTPMPPTFTPVPPTDIPSPIPPTPTPVPQTFTPTPAPPTPTATPSTATSAPITPASSLQELGTFIGEGANVFLADAGSDAVTFQVAPQKDGSLMAFVVDEKGEAFDSIGLSFAMAIYLYREDPFMPSKFQVIVIDSPNILTAKGRGLGIMQVADVIEWGEGNIDTDEFLARIEFRTE